jgi:acyl dehydratase
MRVVAQQNTLMSTPLDYSIATLPAHVGRDFGLSRAMRVAQSRIDLFAECSGDNQWIHVDVERARNSPSGHTIAHGLLLLSLTTKAQYDVGIFPRDAAQILNYGLDKVRFLAPVAAGASVVIRVELADVQSKGPGRTLVRCRNTAYGDSDLDRPVMVAESLALLVA